jgi:hypothetical protein
MADYNAIKYDGFSKGSLVLIKTLTASSSATLSFVNGTSDVVLDSTYKEYLFIFNNIHPATDDADFSVGFRDGSTDYDATKTTTTYYSVHNEGDTIAVLAYQTGHDIAQGTGFCQIGGDALGNDNDQCCSGYMHLFNPSSTTFVKHFMVNMNTVTEADVGVQEYTAGYCNVTAAIDAVQFKFNSGNIDAGTIQLFGVN